MFRELAAVQCNYERGQIPLGVLFIRLSVNLLTARRRRRAGKTKPIWEFQFGGAVGDSAQLPQLCIFQFCRGIANVIYLDLSMISLSSKKGPLKGR